MNLWFLLLIAAVPVFLPISHAASVMQNASDDPATTRMKEIAEQAKAQDSLGCKVGACVPDTAIQISEDSKCRAFYMKLYSKPEAEFTVAFGYRGDEDEEKGGKPNAYADLEAKSFVGTLTRSCRDGSGRQALCGFKVSERDPNRYIKEIKVAGRSTNVAIQIIDSMQKDSRPQEEVSASAESAFLNSLVTSEAVFYFGHSRDGGGPDFKPARKLKNGHIDYPWYRKNKPGVKAIIKKLDEFPGTHAMVYGSFSCNSKGHFYKGLEKHAPKTTFILTQEVMSGLDGEGAMMKTLETLLTGKCADEFKTLNEDRVGAYKLFAGVKDSEQVKTLFDRVYDRLLYDSVLYMKPTQMVDFMKRTGISESEIEKAGKDSKISLMYFYLKTLFDQQERQQKGYKTNEQLLKVVRKRGKGAMDALETYLRRTAIQPLVVSTVLLESRRGGSLPMTDIDLIRLNGENEDAFEKVNEQLTTIKKELEPLSKEERKRIQELEGEAATLHRFLQHVTK